MYLASTAKQTLEMKKTREDYFYLLYRALWYNNASQIFGLFF